jgi:hypothetical protein
MFPQLVSSQYWNRELVARLDSAAAVGNLRQLETHTVRNDNIIHEIDTTSERLYGD